MTNAPSIPETAGQILLPTDRFVVRRVSLDPSRPAAGQVELAVEAFAPFPLEQLFHGHVLAAGGTEALAYAAYRKRFSAAETAGWGAAQLVAPAFVAHLGVPPNSPVIRCWREGEFLAAAAWDGRSGVPAAVLSRPFAEKEALVAELRARSGLAAAPVEELSAVASGLGELAQLPASADVREKTFLGERARTARRDLILWRTFLAAVAGLAVLLLLELGLLGAGTRVQALRAEAAARAPAVEKIAQAQALSGRVAELSKRRLMPFAMLAVLNRQRPATVTFQRANTLGQEVIEVDAQTPNASAAGAYEAVLRAAPEIARVETRDLRSRDNITSFTLAVTFKPEALGGAEP